MTLVLTPRPELDHYELTQSFNTAVSDRQLWVPSGFHYDGASIPSAAWQVIYSPFAPDVMRAALVHDWFYHAHEDGAGDADRRAVDDLLYELLKADGVSKVKREVMWSAVRNFGAPYWENDDDARRLLRSLYRRHQAEPDVAKYRFPTWATG